MVMVVLAADRQFDLRLMLIRPTTAALLFRQGCVCPLR
jgi:hypothetical protein